MNLQAKVMLILVSVWIIICSMVIIDSKLIIAENYKDLETMLTRHLILDTQHIFDRLLFNLSIYTLAWSQWDEAYHFMEVKNEPFIKSNFVPAIYRSAELNFIIFFDAKHNLYYGQAYHTETDKMEPVPQPLLDYLAKNKAFLTHNNPYSSKVGILQSKLGLIVMSSRPIVTSNAKSPVIGSILMGYYVDHKLYDMLAQIIGLNINFIPITSVKQNTYDNEAYTTLISGKQYSVIVVNSKLKYGYFLLKDINANPVGLIRIDLPRLIYQEGVWTTYHYIIIVILSGIIIILIMGYLLKALVLDRVISINDQMAKINREMQFNNKINISGHDELSNMVYTINNMLALIHHSQSELHYLATHDPFTKLPNREHFYHLLNHAISEAKATNTKMAIMFLDMDKLKKINDKYGHAVGDKLIKIAAERIQQSIRSVDVLGHQSGDEFILFMPHIPDTAIVSETANKILQATSEPFIIQSHSIIVSFSIGISIYPDNGVQSEELVKNADHVMYLAKTKAGNNYQYYKTT